MEVSNDLLPFNFCWLASILILHRPSIAETGIPHATTEDDEFEGYRIPAGTVVTYNIWGIANDPSEYDQPERFWPERFLDDDLDKFLKGHLGFGAGKHTPFPEVRALDFRSRHS